MRRAVNIGLAVAALGTLPVASPAQTFPVCDAGGPYYASPGEEIAFDGTASYDPDGVIIEYLWFFGDGGSATGGRPEHTYDAGGVYIVTLEVTDDRGNVSTCNTIADVELDVPPLPRPMTLGDYVVQADDVLPAIDEAILDAPTGPDWFLTMTIDQVSGAMADGAPGTILVDGDVWIGYDDPDSTSARYVKLDFGRDYLRYINQDRAFDILSSPHSAIGDELAFGVFSSAADALGIPVAERGVPIIDTIVSLGYDEGVGESTEIEVERLVTLPRQFNGFPVFGSRARMAVSNRGRAARALVEWPRFVMPSGLELLPREDVVQKVAELVWESEEGVAVQLDIRLGYALTPSGYLPVARTSFSDAGGVMESGVIAMVPLVDTVLDAPVIDASASRLALRVLAGVSNDGDLVQFELPTAQRARVAVYDAGGRLVRTLADGRRDAGRHDLRWDGRGHDGRRVASGVYFVTLDAESGTLARKLVRLH